MFNNFFKRIISPKNKRIIVIAEMSGNHQGKFIKTKNFVDNAIRYGADVIKFQVYKPDTITLNSRKNYTLNHLIERIKTYNEENFNYEIITIQLKNNGN